MSGMSSKPINIRDVSKTFVARSGEVVQALQETSIFVSPGEFVAIVGPSGCGKSTLLNMVAGFEQPTRGSIDIAGAKVTRPDIDRGMVFQSYALFPWRNVLKNVEFGLEQRRTPKAERTKIAMHFLKTVGLESFANRQVDELSGGMKQRVAIARAFAADPAIILMDEPFGALDALSRRTLQHELLRTWQQNRKTVMFITHSVAEAVYLADRVLVMTGRPGSIRREYPIQFSHPRDNTSSGFRQLEQEILSMLDGEEAFATPSTGRAANAIDTGVKA